MIGKAFTLAGSEECLGFCAWAMFMFCLFRHSCEVVLFFISSIMVTE